MRNTLIALTLLALFGCVSSPKIDSGDRQVGERMTVSVDGAWNRVFVPVFDSSPWAERWTIEGMPIDELLMYSGLKDGQAISVVWDPGTKTMKNGPVFKSGMRPDEVAALFEGWFTTSGSHYKLIKLEPVVFGGGNGFRFEFSVTSPRTTVEFSGIGYGAVSKGELFAIVYRAPRLYFFPRYAPKVEQMARSARVSQ